MVHAVAIPKIAATAIASMSDFIGVPGPFKALTISSSFYSLAISDLASRLRAILVAIHLPPHELADSRPSHQAARPDRSAVRIMPAPRFRPIPRKRRLFRPSVGPGPGRPAFAR